MCSHLVLVLHFWILKVVVLATGSSWFGLRRDLKVMLILLCFAFHFLLFQSYVGHKLVIGDFPGLIKLIWVKCLWCQYCIKQRNFENNHKYIQFIYYLCHFIYNCWFNISRNKREWNFYAHLYLDYLISKKAKNNYTG